MRLLITILSLGLSFGAFAEYDRPNFICQTSPNAAQMFVEANIYTDYYSRTVRVRLEHVSTYRRELIMNSLNEKPVIHTSSHIVLASRPTDPSSPFPPLSFLEMDLEKVSGRKWKATIRLPANTMSQNPKPRQFEMACFKN